MNYINATLKETNASFKVISAHTASYCFVSNMLSYEHVINTSVSQE